MIAFQSSRTRYHGTYSPSGGTTLKKSTFFHMLFYKKLSMSAEMTHGDNYIFAVFDLIFYYCC